MTTLSILTYIFFGLPILALLSLAVIIPLFRNPDAEEPRPEPKLWTNRNKKHYCECGEEIDEMTMAALGECHSCYHKAYRQGERN